MKKLPKVDSAILEWAEQFGIVNSKRTPFEFDGHSFLLDPLCDWSQKIAIRKSAQIGFSESFGILKALFAAKYYDLSVIYTLPTTGDAENFVNTKVNPIIDYNPVVSESVSQSTLGFKQVKDRFIFFRGTYSQQSSDKKADSSKGISITSDLNIYDEHDRSDQFVIDQFGSRLENSDYGGEWSFSNPTYPGVGVDRLFELSDQKHWFVTCEHCGHKQYLDWIKLGEVEGIADHCLVDTTAMLFVCGKCRKHLSDTTRMRGEWVPKFPDREISGYWMSQMNYPKHSVKTILSKEEGRTRDNFFNFVLGKAYKGADVNIDRQVIYSNIRPTTNTHQNVAMGVDQGVKKHYVLRNETGIFKVGVTDDWKEIEQLIRTYNATTVIDAMPYSQPVQELIERFPGNLPGAPRVFMCWYKEPKDNNTPVEWLKGKRRHEVQVHRTLMFDIIVDKFVHGQMPINMAEKEISEFAEHWSTMFRSTKEDGMGVPRPTWESSNKAKDHFAHATLYSEVALSKITGLVGGEIGGFAAKQAPSSGKTIVSDENWTSALPTIEELTNPDPITDWRYN